MTERSVAGDDSEPKELLALRSVAPMDVAPELFRPVEVDDSSMSPDP
jgi:hypothetical protein